MKVTKIKRFMAFFLTAVMMLSMSVTAFAEEGEGNDYGYTKTNPYVINFTGVGLEEEYKEYEALEPLLYSSVHYGYLNHNGKQMSSPASAEIMNLINTVKLKEEYKSGKTGAYASLAAYCVDALTGLAEREGYDFQRVNLEDATWFDDEAAGKVRAIYMNAFPYLEVEELQKRVNTWLAATDPQAAEITDLTAAEVASAAQIAIWTTVNADENVTLSDVYVGTYKATPGQWVGVVTYSEVMVESAKNTTESNMEKVYDYMKSLKPVAASSVVVSEASFTKKELTVADNGDGTYDVTVSGTVDVAIGEKDEMVLTAVLGEAVEDVKLKDGVNSFEITFKNVTSLADVELNIDGYQTAEGVFLFVPVEGRKAAQCLVAADKSQLPVHAQTTVGLDRIINIKKTTNINGTYYPLEGIAFDIYYVCSVDEYTENISQYEDASKIDTSSCEFITTVTTDITGKASYNLTENDREDGIYLVIEQENAAIEKALAPFLIAVPMTTEDGEGLTYIVNVEPKNNVLPGPDVDTDVTQIGNKSDSLDVGEEATWIIRGEIPADIADAKEYVMTDDLNYQLTYSGNLIVKVEATTAEADNSAETHNVLEKGTDYNLAVTKGTVDVEVSSGDVVAEEISTIVVELTQAGMDKVAEIAATAEEGVTYEVRVYFNAVIDEDAIIGTDIPNTVTLDYTNSVNIKWKTEPEKVPVVYTCGINIYKYDTKDAGKALEGAVFKLARVVTDAEVEAGKSSTLVTSDGAVPVVYEEFYKTVDLSGEKVSTVTTDANGNAVIYGLEEGEYYLVEIQAPTGYNLLSYPLEVTLNKVSHVEENTVKVANSNTFKLPTTGGIGTTIFTVGGMTLVAAAIVILVMKKKKEEN